MTLQYKSVQRHYEEYTIGDVLAYISIVWSVHSVHYTHIAICTQKLHDRNNEKHEKKERDEGWRIGGRWG